MPEMRESQDGGGERPTETGHHQEVSWLEYLQIKDTEGARLAWAGPGRWRYRKTENLKIIVIPRLHLSRTMVFRLTHGRSLPDVFRGCSVHAPSITALVSPVAGKFPLYRNGKPELLEAAFVLEGSDPKSIGEIVKEVASLLT